MKADETGCTTWECDAQATDWVVLYDCDEDPCTGHAYCRDCADALTSGTLPSGCLGHAPTSNEDDAPVIRPMYLGAHGVCSRCGCVCALCATWSDAPAPAFGETGDTQP